MKQTSPAQLGVKTNHEHTSDLDNKGCVCIRLWRIDERGVGEINGQRDTLSPSHLK